ncbi:MAG: adenylate/guanylate cyclase domain-containing protein [Crenarchaeota archaeon]|nr:adenylate/guanylate cyclase domain-containing protein [Thermoproteota archaeon]
MQDARTVQYDLNYFRKMIDKHEDVSFFEKQVSGFIGIVDIVDSTNTTSKISSSEIAKYYGIFLNSMSSIVREFGGIVVKNLGDCVLYYFDNESSRDSFKQIIECGLTMIDCHSYIEKILEKEKLPRIKYRVSCEYGNMSIAKTSTSPMDVFGHTVNYCSKINRCAPNNGMVIGSDLYTIAKKCNDYVFKSTPSFLTSFKQTFPSYIITRE